MLSPIVNQSTLRPGIYNQTKGKAPVTTNRTGACEIVYHIDHSSAHSQVQTTKTVLYPKNASNVSSFDIREGDPIILKRGKHTDTSSKPYAQTNLVGLGTIDTNLEESLRIPMAKLALEKSLTFGGISVSNVDLETDLVTFNGAVSGNITLAMEDTNRFKMGDVVRWQLPDPNENSSMYMQNKVTMKIVPYKHEDVVQSTMLMNAMYLRDDKQYKSICKRDYRSETHENFIKELTQSARMDGLLLIYMLVQAGILGFHAGTNNVNTVPQMQPATGAAAGGFTVNDILGGVASVEDRIVRLSELLDCDPRSADTAPIKKYFNDFDRVYRGMTISSDQYNNFEFGATNATFLPRDTTSNQLKENDKQAAFVKRQLTYKRNQMAALSALVQAERQSIVGKVIRVNENSIEIIINGNGS